MNTLLIVEDEKMIRQGIKTMIQNSKISIHNIIECKNGLEALNIIENQIVDVMIMDIHMPKMDGITLVKKMQKCSHIPLTVVVSGYDEFSYVVELLRYGIKDYILKPIERVQIINIIQKLDEEIRIRNEKQQVILNIENQQLKYLLLNNTISQNESEIIIKRFESYFLKYDYVLCCSNYEKESISEREGIIYLKNVDKHGIFIVEQSKLDTLLKNELRDFYVGCSTLKKQCSELKDSYKEAVEARKKAFAMSEHLVVYSKENPNYESLTEQDINPIVQILGTSKIAEAIKAIDHIYYKLKTKKISPDNFYESMKAFIDKVITTYKNAIDIDEKKLISFYEVYTYNTSGDYCNDLKECLIQLNDKLNTEFGDYRNKQKIQQAILYINQNYNKNLNMAVVSNYVSMNYSLFSYAFKQYTGCNFVNYLKEFRIAKAKRLLETTDMLVIEIGQAVGYENDKNFMKIFKGICGVSPSEYRKNTQLGKKYN